MALRTPAAPAEAAFPAARCIGQRFPAGAAVRVCQRRRAQRDPAQNMTFLAAHPIQFDHTLFCQLSGRLVDGHPGRTVLNIIGGKIRFAAAVHLKLNPPLLAAVFLKTTAALVAVQ